MKKLLLILVLFTATQSYGSEATEVFASGLRAFQANGPDALLNAWYGPAADTRLPELRNRFISTTATLGPVVETETFEPKMIGKRVTRLYGVIYFRKKPLWIRADYYHVEEGGGFIALEFSTKPEEILPLEVEVGK